LQRSVQAYQDERDQLSQAYDKLTSGLGRRLAREDAPPSQTAVADP
jgi:hypothetical protein